jgi:SNF2-related domain
MLQREQDDSLVPNPLFIPLTTVDQTFLQPATGEVCQEHPMTAPCRGGILCEEQGAYGPFTFCNASAHHNHQGTGKTLITLTLIAATLKQISAPEDSPVLQRPVMTPLSIRHFPSGEVATSPLTLSCVNRQRNSQEIPRVPSLTELMLHRSRTAPYCDIPKSHSSTQYCRLVEFEGHVNNLPLGKLLHENCPFYFYYSKKREPRVMFLTSATLVIVPAKTMSHWVQENSKHCYPRLRVLELTEGTDAPSVKSLATDFDVGRIRFLLRWNQEN